MRNVLSLAYPFSGTWLVQNSPANRVPSHGTSSFAASYAIDFVPLSETRRSAPITLRSLVRPEPPESFPGVGREVLSPGEGTIVVARDDEPDHSAYRGLPSVGYALAQGRRAVGGWPALAGNYILMDVGGVIVALCHLRQHSVRARPGQAVRSGEVLAACGNSGNSTEPHLPLQAMDGPDALRADAVPIVFDGALPANGEIVSA